MKYYYKSITLLKLYIILLSYFIILNILNYSLYLEIFTIFRYKLGIFSDQFKILKLDIVRYRISGTLEYRYLFCFYDVKFEIIFYRDNIIFFQLFLLKTLIIR